jgi:predicted CopG family antitoxin
MRKAARKAPSRVRYEKAHPTVSCRVSRDIYERLVEVRSTNNSSFTDILKIGLGIVEPRKKELSEVRSKEYIRGHQEGYAKAETIYKVVYSCAVCGAELSVTTKDEKKAISTYMKEHGWCHSECHKRNIET